MPMEPLYNHHHPHSHPYNFVSSLSFCQMAEEPLEFSMQYY